VECPSSRYKTELNISKFMTDWCAHKSLEKNSKPWFYVGDRFCNIHHARLRIGCSFLKSHLCNNLHVIDSPYCDHCPNQVEDPYHYFFVCPKFTEQRISLLNDISVISQPRLGIILYGDESLNTDTNCSLVECIHRFIANTGRFKQVQIT